MLPLREAYDAALTSGVRVMQPRALRLIRLTGPQRVWFLQNTITADVEDTPDGRWVESCFLDPKGRIQAHFKVGFQGDEIWLDVEPDAGARLVDWFTTYRFRTKVEIEAVDRPTVTVIGPAAAAQAGPGEIKAPVTFGYRLGDVEVADVHIDDPVSPNGLAEAPAELFHLFRIEAGVGAFGIDFGERELPQEAGLTRTLSVQKGCYVGQETVARIHFRGHVNRVLRPLEFPSTDTSDLIGRRLLYKEGPAGHVTSAVDSPRRGPVGIGMVRVEPPAGATLEVEGGGRAVVGPLPEGTKVKAD